jgi:drug/metabolite transporter (DMT)-like permease
MCRYRDGVLFVFVAAVLGSAFVAIRVGVSVVPPVFFAALRYDFTAIVLLVLAFFSSEQWRPRTRRDLLAVVCSGGLLIGANNALLFLGQQYTTSAVAAVIHTVNPILTMVVAYALIPTSSPSVLEVIGIVLGLGGVAVIARPDPSNVVTTSPGVVLILLAASSVAVGSVAIRWIDISLSSVPLAGWASAFGAGLLYVGSHGMGEYTTAISWTPSVLLALLFLAIPGGVVSYWGYFYLIDRIGPTQSNLISYVAPLFAAVTGWLLLGESIRPSTLGGLLIVFVGFVLVKRRAIAAGFET